MKVTTASSGETIVNTNAEAPTQTVELVASGTGAVTINAAESAQTVKVEGSVSNEATPLVLSGNEGTTFTVDGSQMSKLSNLKVEGAGTTTVNDLTSDATSFALTTDNDVTFNDVTMNSVKTFTIDATGADNAVMVYGGEETIGEGQEPKSLGLNGVAELTVTGDQAVTVVCQLGTLDIKDAVVTAGEGGLTIKGAGICSAGATFNGSDAVDDIVITMRGDSSLNMGKGADSLLIDIGHGAESGEIYKATVNLGAGDGAKDIITFYSDAASDGTENRKGCVLLTVNDFEVRNDKIGVDRSTWIENDPDGDSTIDWITGYGGGLTSWQVSGSDANATQVNAVLSAFGVTETVSTVNIKGNFLVVGSDAYALYYTAQAGVMSRPDNPDLPTVAGGAAAFEEGNFDACALVKLVGVGNQITDGNASSLIENITQ